MTEREEEGVIKPDGALKSHTCNEEFYLWYSYSWQKNEQKLLIMKTMNLCEEKEKCY